jgi:hypothetical protein
MTYLADPLAVPCSHCGAKPGRRCRTSSGFPARSPHACRVKLALVLAAHSDPALDEFFPYSGPCQMCSTPGLGARHRVIDAIAGRIAAGEDPAGVAADYGVPAEAADVLTAWSLRWPGAW